MLSNGNDLQQPLPKQGSSCMTVVYLSLGNETKLPKSEHAQRHTFSDLAHFYTVKSKVFL